MEELLSEIRKIINEWESLEKEDFIIDLLRQYVPEGDIEAIRQQYSNGL